jgi:hypothetical protein
MFRIFYIFRQEFLLFVCVILTLSINEIGKTQTAADKMQLSYKIDKSYEITGHLNVNKIVPCRIFEIQFSVKNISTDTIPFRSDSNDVLSESIYFHSHPALSPTTDRTKIQLRSFKNNLKWFFLQQDDFSLKQMKAEIIHFKI